MRNNTANIYVSAKDDTKKAFDSINNNLDALRNTLTRVVPAAMAFDMLKDKIGAVIDKFSDLQDFDNFGVAVDDAKRFVDVLGMSGASVDQVKKSFSDLTSKINESFDNEKTARYFRELEISTDDLRNKPVAEIYDKALVSLGKMEDKTKALVISKELWGKNGFVIYDASQEERTQRISERTKKIAEEIKLASFEMDEFKKNTNELSSIFENELASALSGPLNMLNAFATILINAKDEANNTNEALDVSNRMEPWRALGGAIIDYINIIYTGFIKVINIIDILWKTVDLIGSTFYSSFQIVTLQIAKWIDFGIRGAVNLYDVIKKIATLDFDNLNGSIDELLKTEAANISEQINLTVKPVIDKKNNLKAAVSELFNGGIVEAISKSNFFKAFDDVAGKAGKAVKKGATGGGGGDGPRADTDLTGKIEAQIKIIEKGYEKEKNLIDNLAKYNELYFSNQLVSITDYYAKKEELANKDYQARKTSLEKELALVQGNIGKANNSKDKNKLNEQLIDLQNKQLKNEQEYNLAVVSGNLAREKALDSYSDSLSEMKAKIAEMNGDFETAKNIRVNIETKNTTKQFFGEDKSIAETYNKKLNVLKNIEAIEKQINQDLSLQKSLEDLSVNSNLSFFEINEKIVESRTKQLAIQEELIKGLKEQAAIDPGNKEIQIKVNNAESELLKLKKNIDPIAEQINNTLISNFESAFVGLVDGTKSAKDAFTDLTKSIEKDILNLITKDLSKQLMESLFGSEGSSNGGVGGIVSGLFGGGGSGGSSGGSLITTAMKMFGGFFADGGYMPAGKSYVVGEKGPEIFTPGQSGYVTNNKLASSGGGSSVQVVMNISTQDAASFKNSSSQIAAQMSQEIARANRNL